MGCRLNHFNRHEQAMLRRRKVVAPPPVSIKFCCSSDTRMNRYLAERKAREEIKIRNDLIRQKKAGVQQEGCRSYRNSCSLSALR